MSYIKGLSLTNAQSLKTDWLKIILEDEKKMQYTELRDKIVSLIFDATPRQGDVFACIARFVEEADGKVRIVQRLIDVAFLSKSMDNVVTQGAITAALQSVGLRTQSMKSSSCDGCEVNKKAISAMERANDIRVFLALCISHCANNAGEKADNYVILARFWGTCIVNLYIF